MSYQGFDNIPGKSERGNCDERWKIIKKVLPSNGVVLDIGAAEGFFLKKIAEETDLLAVGVEKNRDRVLFQQKWLQPCHRGAVVSCHISFGKSLCRDIANTCEWIDCALLLSVLHWINSDEFLENVCKFSGKVIVEIPEVNDYKATGQAFMNKVRAAGGEKQYLEKVSKRNVYPLGSVSCHTSDARNMWLLDGKVTRFPNKPHIDYTVNTNNYSQIYENGKLNFFKKQQLQPWFPGINLATLKKMKIVFPCSDWWGKEVRNSTDALGNIKGDVRIHNLIVTRKGLKWIDLWHHGHKPTINADMEGMCCNV